MAEFVGRLARAVRSRLTRAALGRRCPRALAAIPEVIGRKLTYLDPRALADLALAAASAERQGLPGAILEAGCAKGGSAIVLGCAKAKARRLELYDVFGMIPPPSPEDGADVQERYRVIAGGQSAGLGGDLYYGYEDDLQGKVVAALGSFGLDPAADNIHLIKGLYQDTLKVDGPVALAHIDCDWYESVMVCLRAIEPHLVPGGRLIIDDYGHWSGCSKAVDEYFAGLPRSRYRFLRRSRLHIVKLPQGGPSA